LESHSQVEEVSLSLPANPHLTEAPPAGLACAEPVSQYEGAGGWEGERLSDVDNSLDKDSSGRKSVVGPVEARSFKRSNAVVAFPLMLTVER